MRIYLTKDRHDTELFDELKIIDVDRLAISLSIGEISMFCEVHYFKMTPKRKGASLYQDHLCYQIWFWAN